MKTNENGRSMVEMLGVLAIIGVLSVGGIYGYTTAMRKYRANEIVQTASMLATMAHAANAGLGEEVSLSSSGLITNPGGVNLTGTVAAKPDKRGSGPVVVSVVTIKGPDADTCDAVTAIAPECPTNSTADTAAARAGYCVDTCTAS